MSHKPPSATAQAQAAPSFGTTASVPNDASLRLVYGAVSLTAAASVDAWIEAEVETGVGTGAYDVVFRAQVALGLLQNLRWPFAFGVEGGRRYKFGRSNGAGVAETIAYYSYVDL